MDYIKSNATSSWLDEKALERDGFSLYSYSPLHECGAPDMSLWASSRLNLAFIVDWYHDGNYSVTELDAGDFFRQAEMPENRIFKTSDCSQKNGRAVPLAEINERGNWSSPYPFEMTAGKWRMPVFKKK